MTDPFDVSDAKPLVTIVIPVFNGADYLAQAIDSALAQTWPALEILVVNDGSNDGGATRAIIDGYGSRLKSFDKPNGGVGSALNYAIERMRGDYFCWLSHDDLFEPEKTERQLRALAQFGAPAVVFSDWKNMSAKGRVIQSRTAGGEDFARFPLWAVLEGRINGCTIMVPRRFFDLCGTFLEDLPTTQDYELWFRFACRFPFVHIAEPLVRQRVHIAQGSRISRHLDEASLLWMDMLDRIPGDVMRDYCGSERSFIERTLSFLNRTSYKAAIAGVEQLLADLAERRSAAPAIPAS